MGNIVVEPKCVPVMCSPIYMPLEFEIVENNPESCDYVINLDAAEHSSCLVQCGPRYESSIGIYECSGVTGTGNDKPQTNLTCEPKKCDALSLDDYDVEFDPDESEKPCVEGLEMGVNQKCLAKCKAGYSSNQNVRVKCTLNHLNQAILKTPFVCTENRCKPLTRFENGVISVNCQEHEVLTSVSRNSCDVMCDESAGWMPQLGNVTCGLNGDDAVLGLTCQKKQCEALNLTSRGLVSIDCHDGVELESSEQCVASCDESRGYTSNEGTIACDANGNLQFSDTISQCESKSHGFEVSAVLDCQTTNVTKAEELWKRATETMLGVSATVNVKIEGCGDAFDGTRRSLSGGSNSENVSVVTTYSADNPDDSDQAEQNAQTATSNETTYSESISNEFENANETSPTVTAISQSCVRRSYISLTYSNSGCSNV